MRYAWLAFLLLAVMATAAAAQQPPPLRGRVMAGTSPVPNQPVSLHQVTSTDGRTIATDTTADDGTFMLNLDSLSAAGVRFVAARYQDRLYIGDTFRDAPPGEYLLRVGPGATPIDVGATSAAAPGTPPRETNLAGFMVILVSLLGMGGMGWLMTRRRAPERQVLVEIADLDTRNEVAPLPRYMEERAELVRRLRENA